MTVAPLTLYLTSRSAIDTREDCGYKRYLNYDYLIGGEPIGLEPEEASLPLVDGTWGHTAMARALAGDDVESIIRHIAKGYREEIEERGVRGEQDIENLIREQLAMLEGIVRAWIKVRRPAILDEYEVMSIEEPWDFEIAPGIIEKIRMDAILRRHDDRLLHILDFKFLKYADEVFDRKQEHSKQTTLYVKALSEKSGEYVAGIMYEGCIKGSWRLDTAKSSPWYGQKVQSTPFCYAYEGPGLPSIQTAYTNKKGYRKIRTYEQMSMREWVEWLDENEPNTLSEQFKFTPPVSPTPAQMERTLAQVAFEERQYLVGLRKYQELVKAANGNSLLLAEAQRYLEQQVAPRRENTCFKYGSEYQCAFYHICWNENAEPLEEGGFKPRVSHHSTSLEEV